MTTVTSSILSYSSISLQSGQAAKKPTDAGDFSALLNIASGGKEASNDIAGAGGSIDFLTSIEQFVANITNSLFELGNNDPTTATAAAGIPTGLNSDGTISVDALLNQGGPLPAFLDRVAARYGLDDAHKQALRNIAIQFKETTGSQAEVAQMAEALKNAGIG